MSPGYSRLMGQDEVGTLARLTAHRREFVDAKIAEHKGRIVKTTGDGILIEFPSVVEAVASAVAIQRGMSERNAEIPTDSSSSFALASIWAMSSSKRATFTATESTSRRWSRP